MSVDVAVAEELNLRPCKHQVRFLFVCLPFAATELRGCNTVLTSDLRLQVAGHLFEGSVAESTHGRLLNVQKLCGKVATLASS